MVRHTPDEIREMGRKAYAPHTPAGRLRPWAVWPHTAERVAYWHEGWNEAEAAYHRAISDVKIVNLDDVAWDAIKTAAKDSPWIPPQYTMNDWVSDVCSFLRNVNHSVSSK
jgi:hypothetical protein